MVYSLDVSFDLAADYYLGSDLFLAITNPNAGGTSEFLQLDLPQLNNLEMVRTLFKHI